MEPLLPKITGAPVESGFSARSAEPEGNNCVTSALAAVLSSFTNLTVSTLQQLVKIIHVATPIPGSTGALTPPAAFATLLGIGSNAGNSNYSGLITVQPTTGVILPGIVISQ